MTRSKSARFASVLTIAAAVVVSPLLPGCGDSQPPPVLKDEDAPAAKGKDSMDYFRNQMNTKKGAASKKK